MCGRYYVDQEEDQIEIRKILTELNQRYRDRSGLSGLKTGEIFPTDRVPVLTGDESFSAGESVAGLPAGTRAEIMQWGFPGFGQNSRVLINARAETAAEKPMFRNAVKNGRMLVLASSYFEWQKPEKIKMQISLPQSRLLLMAGLWRSFRSDSGELINSFVIITRPAEDTIAAIHDRMPLILPSDLAAMWLFDDRAALHMLQQPPAVQVTYKAF